MIKLYKEKKIFVPSGNVYKIINKNSNGFSRFGEAYFSFIDYKKIKGWKKHTKMKMNLVVPVGDVEFVFYDQVRNKFLSTIIGESNYKRINVMPSVWFAFRGLSKSINLILNISNIKHYKNETQRQDLSYFKYNWK